MFIVATRMATGRMLYLTHTGFTSLKRHDARVFASVPAAQEFADDLEDGWFVLKA